MGVSLDSADILKIAAEAQVDPRTVHEEIECPGTVRTHSRERVRRALAQREQTAPVTSAEQGRALGLRLLEIRAQLRKQVPAMPELAAALGPLDELQKTFDRAMSRSFKAEFKEELRAYKTNKREQRASQKNKTNA